MAGVRQFGSLLYDYVESQLFELQGSRSLQLHQKSPEWTRLYKRIHLKNKWELGHRRIKSCQFYTAVKVSSLMQLYKGSFFTAEHEFAFFFKRFYSSSKIWLESPRRDENTERREYRENRTRREENTDRREHGVKRTRTE